MTIERRLVVGLNDIKAISLECKSCKRRTTSAPELLTTIPHACACGASWRPAQKPEPDIDDDFVKFLKTVQSLRVLDQKGALGVSVLFEFEEPTFTPSKVG
ncbi:MAG: hypothetical protein LAO77_15960 [Acidobacteriia bacterium]|nr:hypothetical protein [Terriglobia bacterium]